MEDYLYINSDRDNYYHEFIKGENPLDAIIKCHKENLDFFGFECDENTSIKDHSINVLKEIQESSLNKRSTYKILYDLKNKTVI